MYEVFAEVARKEASENTADESGACSCCNDARNKTCDEARAVGDGFGDIGREDGNHQTHCVAADLF